MWRLSKSVYLIAFLLLCPSLICAENVNFVDQYYYHGSTYKPDDDVKPVVVCADLDGDKIDEMVTAIQMHSIYSADSKGDPDNKNDSGGLARSFAYISKCDLKKNPVSILHAMSLNELLGVWIDDDNEKILEVMDLNDDGKKEVAIWSTGGMHYHSLVIVGIRDGKVTKLFDNGSGCPIQYEPARNKNIISVGREDYPTHSFAAGTYLEEIWEWNGTEFVYNKAKSSSPLVTEEEDIDKYWGLVLNGHSMEEFSTPGMQLMTEEEKGYWEYKFKYAQTGSDKYSCKIWDK